MTIRRITAIIVALLVGFSTLASAQEKPHNYEVGAGVNVYGILGSVGGPGRSLGPGVHFEYRYDLSDRLDVGARAYYKYGDGRSAPTGEPTYGITFNQIGLKAVADYNFRPGKLLRPYIGVGAGAGVLFDKTYMGTDSSTYGTVGPRLGLQLWRFRAALEFDFAYDFDYGFLSTETATSLTLSYTF